VSRILIERAASRCRVTIVTARPGVVIGPQGGRRIDKLKEELEQDDRQGSLHRHSRGQAGRDRRPQLVAEGVAIQLERRGQLPPEP